MRQRKWMKPRLIILVRGNKEEAVLDVCKTITIQGAPNQDLFSCDYMPDACYACMEISQT